MVETVTIASGASKTTIVTYRTNDGGTTYHAIPALRGTISLGGGVSVPVGTAENDHLEWDNTGLVWVKQQFLEFQTSMATLGDLRFKNNSTNLAWLLQGGTGEFEIKLDTNNFLDFTENQNGDVTINLRAQHAVNPDNSLTITMNPATGAVATMSAPTEVDLQVAGTDVLRIQAADVEFVQDANLLDNDVINVSHIIGKDAAGATFRIVFDGADDSDTYFADNTSDADRIDVINNGVNYFGFTFESARSRGLIGLTTGCVIVLPPVAS